MDFFIIFLRRPILDPKFPLIVELGGITKKPSKVISSNGMKKLLKKGYQGVITQLCSLDVQISNPPIPKGSIFTRE